jgi:hypothetical protein
MSVSKVRAIVATAVVCAMAAPVALASGLPTAPTASGPLSSSQFKVKPPSIQISNDGSFYFDGRKEAHNHAGPLKWTSWTATRGHGSGFNWVNNCAPHCYDGTFRRYPVKLHMWRPEHLGGHFIFTRMTVTYTAGWPSNLPSKTDVFKVVHKRGRVFSWCYWSTSGWVTY